MPSLHEIEKTVSSLWLDARLREWFLQGADENRAPKEAGRLDRTVMSGTDHKGVELYGRLIHHGHHDVMESIYPYCQKLIGKSWEKFVDRYFLAFPPSHYNLNRICRNFPAFLREHGGEFLELYPYLVDLADYEWIELEVLEADVDVELGDTASISKPEQVAQFYPLVNPSCTMRYYDYPIPDIVVILKEGSRPKRKFKKAATPVAAYRDSRHRARFLELGSSAARLVEKAAASPATYQELLIAAIQTTPELAPEQAAVDFLALVEKLMEAELFVGSKRR